MFSILNLIDYKNIKNKSNKKANLSRETFCPKCKKAICGLCGDFYHKKKGCPKLFNVALKAMKNEKINVCPECFEVYLKDDKCSHVKCLRCTVEFCFECSCFREPILMHGNHYHRPDCKFYFALKKKSNSNDDFNFNCSKCKELGKQCLKPISYKEFFKKYI